MVLYRNYGTLSMIGGVALEQPGKHHFHTEADMSEIAGKTALITGGSRGLGRHIARALARSSARIVLVARSKEGLNQTAREIGNTGFEVSIFPSDISNSSQRRVLIDRVREECGQIDILVNNAGLESEGLSSILTGIRWQIPSR